MVDYSKRPGNPTSVLQSNYTMLMGITNSEELSQAAIDLVEPLRGSGISEKNWIKFNNDIRKAASRGLESIRYYLTNYILSGSDLSVGRGESYKESTEINSIASMITENIDGPNVLSSQQQCLKDLVESCTSFKIVLLEHTSAENE